MADHDYVSPPLSCEQRAIANNLLYSYDNLCLLSGRFMGKDVAFVCNCELDNDEYLLQPLFIVVTPDLHEECRDCDDRQLAA